jgi:hypothetical protein
MLFSLNPTRVAPPTLTRQTRYRAPELSTASRVVFLHG